MLTGKSVTVFRTHYTHSATVYRTTLSNIPEFLNVPEYHLGNVLCLRQLVTVLSTEAWDISQLSPCGIYGGETSRGSGFNPNATVFSFQYYFIGALYSFLPLSQTTQSQELTVSLSKAVKLAVRLYVCRTYYISPIPRGSSSVYWEGNVHLHKRY